MAHRSSVWLKEKFNNMLLIKPSIHAESQSRIISPFVYKTFPTSLGFLAGYLRKYNGIVPEIIDEDIVFLDRGRLRELLNKNNGLKIAGMTSVTINSVRAYQLAKMIKEIDSEYIIILGGIHATVLPEECLQNSVIDIVVRGEGEETLSEVIEYIQNGRDYRQLKGISYRRGNYFIHNPNRPLLDIDKIPPFPYDIFDTTYTFYRDFGTVISSRGCPYDCIFCSQRAISGQWYRSVAVEKILDEVGLLIKKYNQKKIWFMDDNFLVDKKRAFSLIAGIIEKSFHKKAVFVAEMRGDSVTYEILSKMKEANFQMVSFGMETGSQRLLDLIDKKETVEDNIQAIEMAHKLRIKTSATFIFGLPTETRKERLFTAKLARSIPLDDARFNVAVPYPGTKLFQLAKQENRLHIKPGWSNFNVQFYMFGDDIPYLPENTSRDVLIRDTFLANLRFNFRFKTLINFITSPITGGMVLTLPEKWYLSPRQIWRIFRLMLFILKRFLRVLFRHKK